jgi:hypothetical protein
MEELARTVPSIAIARADTHTLRGAVLMASDPAEATQEFSVALGHFASMGSDPAVQRTTDFHLRLGDLLLNLAALARVDRGRDDAARLLARAISTYLDIVAAMAATPGRPDTRAALDTIAGVIEDVRQPDRTRLEARLRELNGTVGGAAPHP